MKKRILLLALMLLPMVAGAEKVKIDGIYYYLIPKRKVAEVTSNPNKYTGSVGIPASVTYEGAEYSVTSIGDYAFDGCSGLTSVTIPGSVMTIGYGTFYGCSGLTSVTIPDSVTSIGYEAFSCCSGLTFITIGNSVRSIGEEAFRYCSGLTFVTVPESVTSIGDYAFDGCSSLTSVMIQGSVTSIGHGAFSGCSVLTSVTIPETVTIIGDGAFANCSGLTSVTIPNSVTGIGYGAFRNCNGLTSITIGSGVKSIHSQAFASCKELTDVYCLAEEVPSTNTDAFLDSYINNVTLHVPNASIDSYKTKEPWKSFNEIKSLTGEDIPETLKCDKPSIIKEGNKFWFECGTPGATIKGKLTPNVEELEFEGSEMVFTGGDITYTLTVIASAEGYEDSDPVKMALTVDNCDTNRDGVVDVADIATIIDRMAGRKP